MRVDVHRVLNCTETRKDEPLVSTKLLFRGTRIHWGVKAVVVPRFPGRVVMTVVVEKRGTPGVVATIAAALAVMGHTSTVISTVYPIVSVVAPGLKGDKSISER